MTTRKRRESIQRVIVVLEGEKVYTEKTGVAPLWRASKYASNTDDEILVLTLLPVDGNGSSSSKGFGGDHQCKYTCEDDPYVRFLRQQVSQRKQDYRRIFRPFYERCKSNGVSTGFTDFDLALAFAYVVKVTNKFLYYTGEVSGKDCCRLPTNGYHY